MRTARRRAAPGATTEAPHRRRALVLLSCALVALAVVGGVGWWATSQEVTPSPEAFCQRLAATADLDQVLLGDATAIAEGAGRLRSAATVAPPEVAADAQVLADAVDRLAEGADRQPLDPQAGMDEALAELQPDLDRITAASQAVGAWARATCGLELDGTRPAGASDSPVGSAPDAPVAAPEGAATPS